MSSIHHLQDVHKAGLWATDLILNTLPESYLKKDINSSFPNIESILIHLWNAQMVWHNRIMGTFDAPLPSKNYDGSYTQLKDGVLASFRIYTVLLEDKTDDFLNKTLTYTTTKGEDFTQPNSQVLLQLTHHSAFHRGQIIGFMRQLGFTDKIESAGGKVLMPKTHITEEIGYMAIFIDSEGNKMALHSNG